jgi:PAS domain S-box-containing protein
MQLTSGKHTNHYFIAIFLIVSALFVTFSAVIYQNYKQAQRVNQWTLYNYEVVRQSRKILMNLLEMETGVRGYLLTKDLAYLVPYKDSKETLELQIRRMLEYTKEDPSTRIDGDVWLEKIEEFSRLLKIQLDQANSDVSFVSKEVLEKQKKQMDSLRSLLEQYIDARLHSLNTQIQSFKKGERQFLSVLIGGTLLAIGGMLLTTLVILTLLKKSRASEKEVATAEDRFKMVINGINDGLYDYNMQDHTLYYSPSYKAMLGYTDDEYPNTLEMFHSSIHPDDEEPTWKMLRKYREGEISTYQTMFRLRHKNGQWLWMLSRGIGIRDKDGVMVRIIGTHTDITAQKLREEELRQLNEELETFTYITSHDLRSPLVNMKGFAMEMEVMLKKMLPIITEIEMIVDESKKKILHQAFHEDLPESLHFIKQSVEKMDMLTTAVLDLSRIGKREYQFRQSDCNVIVERCLGSLAYELLQKNITVNCETLPTIETDPLALEQVFSNILDNAVKYMEVGREGIITIKCDEIGGEMVFSIEDTGRGINEADKEKVFQSFRRARNTSDVRGLGMGMTFVQATIRRLGGRIWFDSEVGKGTTFYFALPKQHYKRG